MVISGVLIPDLVIPDLVIAGVVNLPADRKAETAKTR
jgi:hypothetical protein